MKNYTKGVAFIILASSLAIGLFQGCKKDKKNPIELQDTTAEATKFKKIEKYISIMWSVPTDQINYNKDTQVFKFKDFTVTKTEIEALYDIANEYKFKYEN